MDASDRNEPVTTTPSRIPSADVYLHIMLQRYQNYHDQISVQARLEREVVQMRNCVGVGSSSAGDDIPELSPTSSTYDRSRLRARYAERTPSLSRESSTAPPGRPVRRVAREARKVRFGFGIEPVVGVPCFMVPARLGRTAGLSEVDLAGINFILALESPCWDHFRHHDFHHSCRSDSDAEQSHESGHLMMASALCLASASASVFAQLDDVALAGAAQGTINSQPAISWEGRGLSMKALRRLAHAGDKSLELTPVQAWFELENRIVRPVTQTTSLGEESVVSRTTAPRQAVGSGLMDRHLLDRLKTELGAIVSCSYFGTTMQRSEFEDIVAEVMRER